jgi:hypothetical protein
MVKSRKYDDKKVESMLVKTQHNCMFSHRTFELCCVAMALTGHGIKYFYLAEIKNDI